VPQGRSACSGKDEQILPLLGTEPRGAARSLFTILTPKILADLFVAQIFLNMCQCGSQVINIYI